MRFVLDWVHHERCGTKVRLAIAITGYLGSALAFLVLAVYTIGLVYAAGMIWWRPDMLFYRPFPLSLMLSAVLGAVAASVVDSHHIASIWGFVAAMLLAAFALHVGSYLVCAPWLVALILTALYHPSSARKPGGRPVGVLAGDVAMLLRRIMPF